MGATVYLEKPICVNELGELAHRMVALEETLKEGKKWSEFSLYLMVDFQKR